MMFWIMINDDYKNWIFSPWIFWSLKKEHIKVIYKRQCFFKILTWTKQPAWIHFDRKHIVFSKVWYKNKNMWTVCKRFYFSKAYKIVTYLMQSRVCQFINNPHNFFTWEKLMDLVVNFSFFIQILIHGCE